MEILNEMGSFSLKTKENRKTVCEHSTLNQEMNLKNAKPQTR